jgi:hypothetical protein
MRSRDRWFFERFPLREREKLLALETPPCLESEPTEDDGFPYPWPKGQPLREMVDWSVVADAQKKAAGNGGLT